MAWIPIIADADVLTVLSGPELAGYREAALADGQADPVQPVIDDVTEEVRGYVAACTRNRLGPLGTIPSRLKSTTLDIIAVRIPQRVGRAPKTVRKDAETAAIKRLQEVAAGRFMIDEPEVATTEVSSVPSPSFSGRPRRNTRDDHDGL